MDINSRIIIDIIDNFGYCLISIAGRKYNKMKIFHGIYL